MRRYLVALSMLLLAGSVRAAEQDDAGSELRRHLRGTKWQWDGGAGETIVFSDNGYVEHEGWTRRGLITRWEAVDRRTVLLRIERGRPQDQYALLVFDDDMSLYDGFNFHGGARLNASTQLQLDDKRRNQQAEAADPTFFRATSGTQSLRNGLVAFYPFNGNANDESGNENHGTVHGAILAKDRFGNSASAYSFDGHSYINVPSSTSLKSPSSEYSIAVWARTTEWFSGLSSLVCKGLRAAQYRPQFANTGRFLLQDYVDVNTSFRADLGKWYFFVTVWSQDTASVYVNGSKVGEMSGSHRVVVNDEPLQIGRDQPGALEYMIGEIDDIRIYNRALSQTEIIALSELASLEVSSRDEFDSAFGIADPPPILHGTVSNQRGDPVFGVTVRVYTGLATYYPLATVQTDPKGRYWVRISHGAGRLDESGGRVSFEVGIALDHPKRPQKGGGLDWTGEVPNLANHAMRKDFTIVLCDAQSIE